MSRWSLSLLVAGALVASACGDDGSDPVGEPVPTPTDTTPTDATPDDSGENGGDDGSIDGEWVLVRGFLDGEEIELVDGWDVTLNIDADQIGGTAACNGYGGTVAVGDEFGLGGSFVVGELSWTEMGCEPAVMELEQQFLRALGEVDSYELADTLSLAGADVDTSLSFERVEPLDVTELVGVTWVLDTLITGDTASNSPGMDAAFLEFSDDGMLVGSTGCRRLEGEWSLQGATIQIPILSAIDDPTAGVCSPESEALEGDIIAVIESGTTLQIDGQIEGNRLTLTAPGGDGLSFFADTVEGSTVDPSAPASPDSTVVDDDNAALDPNGGVDNTTRPPRGTSAELTARLQMLGDAYPGNLHTPALNAIEQREDWTGQVSGVLFRETVDGQPGAWLLCGAVDESLPPGCSEGLSLYGEGGMSEGERAQLTSYESEDGSRVVELSQAVVSRTGTMMHDSAWFVVDES